MSDYVRAALEQTEAKNPNEKEFHQAVANVFSSLKPVLERYPEYRQMKILERMTEPERVIIFRVPWVDDKEAVQINRGFRVEMNSALGPYNGGLRFHPTVDLSLLKSLAFEQVFSNSLTSLPMGAGYGGADFDPKGKSDMEIMRFCQSFMNELHRHIGPNIDIPSGDLGVGHREIGYLFGQYKRLRNEFTGVLTGKGLNWGGSLIRPEATGYGVVYFAAEMLALKGHSIEGRTCLVSGNGNVAQYAAEKILQLGGKVVTMSDSKGYIYDEEGIDKKKLEFVMDLKNIRRGSIAEYAEKFKSAAYIPTDPKLDHNPLWNHRAQCAFPCATQNELNEVDAKHLLKNGVNCIAEGSTLGVTAEAMKLFIEKKVFYGPGKAANAGGIAISGLELAQNNMRLPWPKEEVDHRLQLLIKNIHRACVETAEKFGTPLNYLNGANITGFLKVADAMMDQGVV